MIAPSTLRFRTAFLALAALAYIFISDPAIAQPSFPLVGTWGCTVTTGPAPGIAMLTLNANGTFYGKRTFSGTNVYAQWWGFYRVTSATSWVAQIQVAQSCEGFSCSSCPPGPGGDCCAAAKADGIPPGVPMEKSVRMLGPNQFVDELGQGWQRVR